MFVRLRNVIRIALTAFFVLSIQSVAFAQGEWPSKPIKFVIGFSAGGGTDAVLRALASELSKSLGVIVVVENKPGGNANIAGNLVAKSAPDGYTFLYNTSSLITSPYLYSNLNYNYEKELTPVVLTANVPMVLVIGPSIKVESLKEFVSHMKSNPKKLSYAAAGVGNITHLSSLLFQNEFKLEGNNIYYKGEGPGLADVAGGHVDFAVSTAAGVTPLVVANRLKALMVFDSDRLKSLPNVPNAKELGAKDLILGSWSGIMAPAGTSPAIIEKMNRAVNQALKQPTLIKFFEAQGAIPKGGSAQDYQKFLREESKKWGQIIKTENIRPEQ